jgi:hypothetical protein
VSAAAFAAFAASLNGWGAPAVIVRRMRSIWVAEASKSTATRFPDQITSLGTDFHAPIVSPRGVSRNRSSAVTSLAAAAVSA